MILGFRPGLRNAHTATFINNTLYILGGIVSPVSPESQQTFLYLNFSVPFNTNKLEWHELSNNMIPSHRHAAAIGSNNTLFLYGGESDEKMDLVYAFDTQNNTWSLVHLPLQKMAFILDTINLSWKKASSINAPCPRMSNGAVLLPNKNILYMGM